MHKRTVIREKSNKDWSLVIHGSGFHQCRYLYTVLDPTYKDLLHTDKKQYQIFKPFQHPPNQFEIVHKI